MPLHNADIAAAFEEITDLLELGDENPFRIRAYRNAARVVGGLSLDLAAKLAEGAELPKLPGIGADLGGKIREIATTGSCKLLEKLRGRFPAGITELLALPGLGPKRVRALHEARIASLEDLRRAARAGKLPALPGFGEKTAQRITDAAVAQLGTARRFKLAVAALHYFTGSDAHGVDGFDVLRYGVGQARRGWLEKKDVLNARPLGELRRWLAREEAADSAA